MLNALRLFWPPPLRSIRRVLTHCWRRWRHRVYWTGGSLLVILGLWLFVSVDIRLNDTTTIAKRIQALGGLGLTAFFVYQHTPPLVVLADKAALRHGIDPLLFRALVKQESSWNPNAQSPQGAAGLTQLMPVTARTECGLSAKERFEPHKNLNCGAYYFAKQLRRFKNNVELALAAYNSGPTRVSRLGRVPRIPETQAYVSKIMYEWNRGEG